MSDAAIEMHDVRRWFDNGMVRAVDGVTLQIDAGEKLAVVGPSGCGKTTLLGLMGALDFATSGEVRLLGRTITPRARLDRLRSESLGFVFQLHHLIPALTLAENVMMPMRPRRVPARQARRRALDLLERVGLSARADFLPIRVSAGERQRAALARALANDPPIVLADEPTGSLDSASGDTVLRLLAEAAAQRTLVVVTHNPEVAGRFARVVRLADGRLDCGA